MLLLGSIPSPKSREMAFYYGHPQNRFWKVMAVVLGEATLSEIAAGKGAPETIAQKKAMLKKHHVALWDVLDSCTIVGASDTSIEDPVVNNIKELVKKSKVTRIFCTGATAHKLYQKLCAQDVGIDAVKLPSTSPANCAAPCCNSAGNVAGKSRTNFFITNSAMGLRQMFPWHTNRILIFIRQK